MKNILPPMLSVPEAAILLNRRPPTVYEQIRQDRFDLPCVRGTKPQVQTKAVLELTGMTNEQAGEYLAAVREDVA